jgi:hypothetical protein
MRSQVNSGYAGLGAVTVLVAEDSSASCAEESGEHDTRSPMMAMRPLIMSFEVTAKLPSTQMPDGQTFDWPFFSEITLLSSSWA